MSLAPLCLTAAFLLCAARLPLSPFSVDNRVVSSTAPSDGARAGSFAEFSDPGGVATIVNEDIDFDGDMDVVAVENDLDLIVWLNDGSGHLVQQRPQRVPGWLPDPTTLADGDRSTSTIQVRTCTPHAPLQLREHGYIPGQCRLTTSPGASASEAGVTGPHGPRGPPLSLLL